MTWFGSGHGIPGCHSPQGMTAIYRRPFNPAFWTYVIQGTIDVVTNGSTLDIFANAAWAPTIEKNISYSAGQGGYYTGGPFIRMNVQFKCTLAWTGATGDIGPISMHSRARAKRAGASFQTIIGSDLVVAPPYNGAYTVPQLDVDEGDWAETKNVFTAVLGDNQMFAGQGTRTMHADVLFYGVHV